jgi:hypothetical protein
VSGQCELRGAGGVDVPEIETRPNVISWFANKKDTYVTSVARNFVLFNTDLFLFRQRDEDIDKWFVGGDCAAWFYVRLLLVDHIERDSEPVMEDWGWTFAVSVDGVRVTVSVWAFFEIENCWLFGLESKAGCFQRQSSDELNAAKEVVANALETTMAADTRILKRAWFGDNPFELNIKVF